MPTKNNAEKMTITPHMAKKMLCKARPNRQIRTALLQRLVNAIKSGNWRVTGETIIFDDDGYLTDGQHRLRACVEAGISIVSYVVLGGIDPDAILFTDTGAARTPGEALHMLGYADANSLASACRWIRRYETGAMGYRAATLDRAELIEMVDKHSELRESLFYGRRVIKIMTLSLGTALHYLMSRSNRDKANAFFNDLAFGSEDLLSPAVVVREKIFAQGRRSTRYPEHFVAAWVIKAWNLYKGGRTAKIIHWYPDSPTRPEPFPTIQ